MGRNLFDVNKIRLEDLNTNEHDNEYQIQRDFENNQEFKHTTDRYALYLQQKIGTGIEIQRQNTQQILESREKNLEVEDVWINLNKFIYVKSVALAQKSEVDAYLKVGEFWIVVITYQLIASLTLVSGPSIYKFFYSRFFIYIIVYQTYFPLLYWMLLNTRIEHVQKPKFGLMRIFFAVSDLLMFIFIFIRCPSFNSQVITVILFNFFAPLILYLENLVSTELNFYQRIKDVFSQFSRGSEFILSIIFLFKLFLIYKKTIFYVFLVVLIIGEILGLLEVIAVNNFPHLRVKLVVVVVLFKLLKLILLLNILSGLLSGGISTGGFGILLLILTSVNILFLVYRMCLLSTENLVEKLNRSQSE